jgi:hypothetical protein
LAGSPRDTSAGSELVEARGLKNDQTSRSTLVDWESTGECYIPAMGTEDVLGCRQIGLAARIPAIERGTQSDLRSFSWLVGRLTEMTSRWTQLSAFCRSKASQQSQSDLSRHSP